MNEGNVAFHLNPFKFKFLLKPVFLKILNRSDSNKFQIEKNRTLANSKNSFESTSNFREQSSIRGKGKSEAKLHENQKLSVVKLTIF